MKKIFYAFLLLSFSAAAQNDDSVFIRKLANDVLTNRTMYNNLRFLTKNIGGRLAGSPQMVKAEQWGYNALKAAGADNVILQECMVPHWVRGGKDRTLISYKDEKGNKHSKELNVLALGNSLGSGSKGVQGEIVEVHNWSELEAIKDNLKGKIVFMYAPFEETFVKTFEAYGKNAGYRGATASRAAKYGAVGVLVRSMTHAMDNNPHTGGMNYNDSFPKIPAVAVGVRDVEALDTILMNNKNVTASVFTFGKMLPDTIGHNVIGELKGTEHPEQIITIGGHLDSWDVNEGANDDGTGIVQTIEILRAFKAMNYQPKNTIRFVLFANEENGTRGARKYAEEAKAKNEKHIFALESDEGGFTPRGFGFTGVSAGGWEKINQWKKLFLPYQATDFTVGGGGADIGPLNRTFGTPLAGLQPDTQRYFDIHHAVSDTLENVNIREVKLGAINMAALIYLIDKYGLN
jgi:carboxypeptidase Q